MTIQRPEWDLYFMMIAGVAASRSTCLRRRVGAVIVRDNHIISTGYNGAPKGLPHCGEVGCLRTILGIPSGERHEICGDPMPNERHRPGRLRGNEHMLRGHILHP